jgi:hypothetical protein
LQNEFSYLSTATAAIPASGSISAAVSLSGYGVARIYVPSGWTAANLTFQVCETQNGTYSELYDSAGNEYTVTVPAAASSEAVACALDPSVFSLGFQYLILRSGTKGSPVVQTSGATLTLAIRPV